MKSRATLVYVIQEGLKIDVGLVIQHSIIHGFEQGIQGFLHPYLITKLCRNAGVKWNQKEKVRAPKSVIDNAVVVKIQGEDDEVVPRPAGPSQPRPGTAYDGINHME